MFSCPPARARPHWVVHRGVLGECWPGRAHTEQPQPRRPTSKLLRHRANPRASWPLTGLDPSQAQPLPEARGAGPRSSRLLILIANDPGRCEIGPGSAGRDDPDWNPGRPNPVRDGNQRLARLDNLRLPSRALCHPDRMPFPGLHACEAQAGRCSDQLRQIERGAARQHAAAEERVELVFDELRQASASGRLSLSEEALGVLLHQAVQRGLLGAVALVVDRSAFAMRPAGRAGVGLHVMGTGSLGWCSFSRRARQSIRHRGDIHGLGCGTSAAKRCMNSSGDITMWMVPSRQAVLSLSTTCPALPVPCGVWGSVGADLRLRYCWLVLAANLLCIASQYPRVERRLMGVA